MESKVNLRLACLLFAVAACLPVRAEAAVAPAICGPFSGLSDTCRAKATVQILLDVSGSIGAFGISDGMRFSSAVIRRVSAQKYFDVDFGLLQFRGENQNGTQPAYVLETAPTANTAELYRLLNGGFRPLRDGWTRTDLAVNFATKCIFGVQPAAATSCTGVPSPSPKGSRIELIVTDGAPEDGYANPPCTWFLGNDRCPDILDQTIAATDAALYDGVHVLTGGVGKEVEFNNLEKFTQEAQNVVIAKDNLALAAQQMACRILSYAFSDSSCAKPTPTPGHTSTPCVGCALGDPHVRTLDGLAITYVGCGDQLMLADDNRALVYQARHCTRGNEASSTCAIALKCAIDADVVELYTTGSTVKFLVNGKEWDLPTSATFSARGVKVMREKDNFVSICDGGFELNAHVRNALGFNYLDTFLTVPAHLKAKTTGLLGRWDDNAENDLSYPDGRIWNAGHGLDYISGLDFPEIDDVQRAWSVPEGESLFHLSVRDSNAVCSHSSSQLRRRILSSRDRSDLKVAARARCAELGLVGSWARTCEFDYIATNGDSAFVANTARSAALVADMQRISL